MITLLSLITIGLLSLAILIYFWLISKKKNQKQQAMGLEWLILLRMMVADVQRHRGLSSAFLKGDQSVEGDLSRIQREISLYISKIETVDRAFGENPEWKGIKDHWGRLSSRYDSLELKDSLAQHGKVISNILYLIEEVADQCDLLNLKNIDLYGYDFVWKDLLESIEYMGQLRALGTGIAASGSCGSVERIRLNYLKDKISSVVERLGAYVQQSPQDKEIISRFIQMVEIEIIRKERLTLSSQEYFKVATQAIDAVYGEYDRILKNVQVA